MADRKLDDPQLSIAIEPGKWYWGTVCPNCNERLAIEPSEIDVETQYSGQTREFSYQCILCLRVSHCLADTIKSFRGQ
jgi:uncharacterized protein YlaI